MSLIILLASCNIEGQSGVSQESSRSDSDSTAIFSGESVAESVIVSGMEWTDSSVTQFSEISTTDYTSPEQLIAYEFLEKVEVFNNITMGNLPYAEITNPSPDLTEYYIVNDNRFKSFSDIQEFFYTIYKKEEADEYFELITTDQSDEFGTFPIVYVEKNGVLYIHKDCIDNGWRISDSYVIRSAGGERIDDNNLIVTAYAYRDYKDTSVFSTFKLTYINGNWIFDGDVFE